MEAADVVPSVEAISRPPQTDRLIKPPAQLTPTQNNVALFPREKKGLFLRGGRSQRWFTDRLSECLSPTATNLNKRVLGAQKR